MGVVEPEEARQFDEVELGAATDHRVCLAASGAQRHMFLNTSKHVYSRNSRIYSKIGFY